MTTLAPPIYDPADPALRRNPFPLFARLQDEDPVHWSPALRAWVLTRYEDVRQMMLSDTMSPDRLRPFYAQLTGERRDTLAEVMRYLSLWMVFRDPPEHTRLRRLVGTVFNLKALEGLAGPVAKVVDHLLDRLPTDRPVDWAQQVAMPLPAYVILDMLKIPYAAYPGLKAASDELRAFVGGARADADRYARARSGAERLAGFFREVIAERRAAPGDDFVSRMIAARDEEGRLSEDELVATCMLVLFAGHETTTHLLGNALNALLDHPGQLQRLRDDPALIDSAVEEFLRYDGPSNAIARVVKTEHAIDGRRLQAGDRVFGFANAANRDPRAFADPQGLDIARTPNRHLTFGFGLHFCMGAPLARLEARLCTARLVQRFSRIERLPRPEGEPEWIDALAMRGVSRLPVRLG
ncbi:MAG: cytochrome P450 [Burkholderiaceae bacterium]|nr:cytochrome P450 [Burkholderiaceae bacterium]